MKKWTTLALTALAGAAIGALAVERIHAQTTKSPAAYYVVARCARCAPTRSRA